ncbi:MAG: glycosyltransferase, partial [Phycisphaeraceae bacterium]
MDDLTAIVEAAWPVWLVLWAGWVTQAVLAALLVRKFLHRRVMRGSFRVFDAHRPRAWVMVPFKGADDDLPAAIDALLTQDHDDYRLICIVESEDDPAYPILQRELARHREASQSAGALPDKVGAVVVAGRSPDDRGQKVHNLLQAIEHVDADSDDSDVWVFADSDAVPGPQWLGKMIGPLGTEGVGV